MSNSDPEFWEKATKAQDLLVAQYIRHPLVSLIDIGFPPAADSDAEALCLRIHLRREWFESNPEERTNFPTEVDGIPVIVMPGDYKLD